MRALSLARLSRRFRCKFSAAAVNAAARFRRSANVGFVTRLRARTCHGGIHTQFPPARRRATGDAFTRASSGFRSRRRFLLRRLSRRLTQRSVHMSPLRLRGFFFFDFRGGLLVLPCAVSFFVLRASAPLVFSLRGLFLSGILLPPPRMNAILLPTFTLPPSWT